MSNSGVRPTWLSVTTAALAGAFCLGPLSPSFAVDDVDPAEGRINWRVDQHSGFATQYVRQSSRSSVCDIAVWDNPTFFARVTFCETFSGWFWKPSYMTLDLMMDEFSYISDFITSGPEPYRDIVANIGEVELYGFTIDQNDEIAAWQCVAFIKGFNKEDRGYHQMIMAFFCDDTGQGITDARLDEVLAGLTIVDVFEQFAD